MKGIDPMGKSMNWFKIVGLVIHVLIAAVIIMAGSFKLLGSLPPQEVEQLQRSGLEDQMKLIGVGELITGILLIVPWTASLGVLLASGLWGGTIVAVMSQHQSYMFQAALLALTWVGAYLRLPEMFSSFWRPWGETPGLVDTVERRMD
jgi:hypothetical protein